MKRIQVEPVDENRPLQRCETSVRTRPNEIVAKKRELWGPVPTTPRKQSRGTKRKRKKRGSITSVVDWCRHWLKYACAGVACRQFTNSSKTESRNRKKKKKGRPITSVVHWCRHWFTYAFAGLACRQFTMETAIANEQLWHLRNPLRPRSCIKMRRAKPAQEIARGDADSSTPTNSPPPWHDKSSKKQKRQLLKDARKRLVWGAMILATIPKANPKGKRGPESAPRDLSLDHLSFKPPRPRICTHGQWNQLRPRSHPFPWASHRLMSSDTTSTTSDL